MSVPQSGLLPHPQTVLNFQVQKHIAPGFRVRILGREDDQPLWLMRLQGRHLRWVFEDTIQRMLCR